MPPGKPGIPLVHAMACTYSRITNSFFATPKKYPIFTIFLDKMKPLNPKQQKFADEYLIDANSRQAVIRAGYSPKHAKHQAYYLMRHPAVLQYLADKRTALGEATGIKAQAVLERYAAIAFFDIRTLYDEHQNLIPLHQLSPATAAAIAAVETLEKKDGTGKLVKVRLHDKIDALNALAKHLGLFEKHNVQQKEEDRTIVFIGDMEISRY